MGRPRLYANATERQRAHRRRQRAANLQALCPDTERLIALQEAAARQHVGASGRRAVLQHQATAAPCRLHEERKERDMLDALWTLQTLIADFGYDEVERHVLQHVRRS